MSDRLTEARQFSNAMDADIRQRRARVARRAGTPNHGVMLFAAIMTALFGVLVFSGIGLLLYAMLR